MMHLIIRKSWNHSDVHTAQTAQNIRFSMVLLMPAVRLFVCSHPKKIVNLMNERIERTNQKPDILMDATFRTCPYGPFKQLPRRTIYI